ncbi:hypothetical protein P152DRAFT_428643 [Eremomyces bilateralis CBS 781.70]|uniref:Zn(2)-C6 fungal-type domain-containing protein n=1 Tax=Eremomyces bilateralis CBS 781.70 TaxID=1392243 RepID=A0A6G1GF58_9PEZI|nr:uncharacterized protein P152DRAFT_428643 [Eremomyces bilateralis CBS 781.70]KAF1816509.1 hypothetical protein P152DRAFT_428643 [Eremomyces bilateralis CBS 781.70]
MNDPFQPSQYTNPALPQFLPLDGMPSINRTEDSTSPPTASNASATNSAPHTASSPPSNLNPRSCMTCRRRKVRCDKRQPCSNCARARIECIFPGPGRAPRRPRKPADAELLERLRKLEGVVQTLGTQVQEETGVKVDFVDEKSGESGGKDGEEMKVEKGLSSDERVAKAYKELKEAKKKCADAKKECADAKETHSKYNGLEARFGRLVVDEGRSRYVTSNFWANLGQEVEDIRAILNESEEEEEEEYSPGSSHQSSHQGYIFGYSSKSKDLSDLHPPADLIPVYWEVFKENIDPLLKILHVPTMEQVILDYRDNLDTLKPGCEALLFAIYYNCATSTTDEECRNRLQGEKAELIPRYRFAVEQALARANFLQSDEIIVLQAFVMFLVALRRNDDARVIWTLVGLIVRMAQSLGLHRDGTHFNLKPFEIEMRRRLWWQTCILDIRAAEDHGCDPTITEHMYDTKCPLNINDSDLHPDMTSFPDERIGCTDMTFSIIRIEITRMFRRLHFIPANLKRCPRIYSGIALEKREQWITELHQNLEDRYLQHCDMSIPLHWVIATVSRLTIAKMWLIAYHPFQRLDGGKSLPQATKDKLFVTSLENVEYALLLEKEERTRKWGWLFTTYMQWHAIAYLLTELCVRTSGDTVERAWHAVDEVTQRRWGEDVYVERGSSNLWKPLRKLIRKARAAREQHRGSRKGAEKDLQASVGLRGLEFEDVAAMNFWPESGDLETAGTAPAVEDISPGIQVDAGIMSAKALTEQQARGDHVGEGVDGAAGMAAACARYVRLGIRSTAPGSAGVGLAWWFGASDIGHIGERWHGSFRQFSAWCEGRGDWGHGDGSGGHVL